LSEIKEARLQKASSLVSKGFASYAQSFKVSHTTSFLIQKFDYLENGQEEDFSVSLAGRVMAKRVMGKIAFFTISDQEGQIQLYLDKKIINMLYGFHQKELDLNTNGCNCSFIISIRKIRHNTPLN